MTMSTISGIYSNSYFGKAQLEQARPAGAQAGRSSSDSLAVEAEVKDTVNISESALKLQESSENMDGRDEDAFTSPDEKKQAANGATPLEKQQPANVAAGGASKAKDEDSSDNLGIETIRKMIKSVEKQKVAAEEKLAEAQTKVQQAAKDSSDGGAGAEVAQAELQAVMGELKSLDQQLMGLREELADAISGQSGSFGGPPGAAGGTRAMGIGNSLG